MDDISTFRGWKIDLGKVEYLLIFYSRVSPFLIFLGDGEVEKGWRKIMCF